MTLEINTNESGLFRFSADGCVDHISTLVCQVCKTVHLSHSYTVVVSKLRIKGLSGPVVRQ